MKIADVEILIIPGHGIASEDHWYSRWARNMRTARRVEQDNWLKPVRADWTGRIAQEVNKAEKPVIFVAHGLGVPAVIQAISDFKKPIAGAFFVSPPDFNNREFKREGLRDFGPYPRDPLPFRSMTVASQNSPYGSFDHAGDIANAWGSFLLDAGQSGNIDAKSGHGPWPEGTMVFAEFMKHVKVD